MQRKAFTSRLELHFPDLHPRTIVILRLAPPCDFKLSLTISRGASSVSEGPRTWFFRRRLRVR